MKEFLRQPLTSQGQPPYASGGDFFMPTEGQPMPPINSNSTSPERSEVPSRENVKPVSAERQRAAREAWEEFEKDPNLPVDLKAVIKAGKEQYIKRGLSPFSGGAQEDPAISQEEAARRREQGAGGVPPGDRPPAPPSPANPPEDQGEARPHIDITGLTDQRVLQEVGALDSLLESGLPTDVLMNSLGKSIDNISKLSNVSPAEKQRAMEIMRQAIRVVAESQRSQRKEFADEIKKVSDLPPGDQKMDKIMELLKMIAPQRDYLDSELIRLSLSFDETFDYMVNKIISLPLSQETSNYQLGLTSTVNLELIASVVNDEVNSAKNKEDRDKYAEFSNKLSQAQDSVKLLHEMNRLVRNGELDHFIQTAGSITPEHFNYLQRLSGVSTAMRIYEQVYDEFHIKNGWIYSEDMLKLNERVFDRLRHLNSKQLFGRELEEWELRRAHAVAGKMYNITLRSAEKIATGTVPREDPDKKDKLKEFERLKLEGRHAEAEILRGEIAEAEIKGKHRYSSFPFESMGRIMNPIQLLIWRFQVASDEHHSGEEFLKVVKKYYKEFLKHDKAKLGVNKITKLGGVNVEEMEYGGMFGVSGVYSGWRQESMFISQMKTGEKTVQEWLANHTPEIEQANNAFKAAKKDAHLKHEAQMKMAEVLGPLIESTKAGRGILLKQHGSFSGEVGYEARKLLWEKIAEENISLMINYLSGIKFENGVQNVPSLNDILRNVGGGVNMEEFEQKILLEQEIKIRKAGRELHPDLFKGQNASDVKLPVFDANEQRLKEGIISAGKKLAPHLADIAFPYTPFINDALFEVFDYRVAGHEFYRRRLASDTPSFNKASGAFIGIVDNPGADPESILKQMHEVERGIESPQGRPDAQKRVFPMAEAWLDWIMTKPGERHAVFKSVKQSLLKPTSKAQEHSSMDAPSVNEDQTRKLIEHLVHQAILDEELADELKKKKNVKMQGLLWALFRDTLSTLIPAALVYSVGKESIKPTKS